MVKTMMLEATVEQNDMIKNHSTFVQLGLTKPGEEWINILPRKRGRKIILQTDSQRNRWECSSHRTMGMTEETNKAILCKSDFFF